MTVKSITTYYARCDAPRCKNKSSDHEHGNNTLYYRRKQLREQFTDTNHEGTLADEHNWLRVVEPGGVEKHYCGEHTTWDDDTDTRIPNLPSPSTHTVEPLDEAKETAR